MPRCVQDCPSSTDTSIATAQFGKENNTETRYTVQTQRQWRRPTPQNTKNKDDANT